MSALPRWATDTPYGANSNSYSYGGAVVHLHSTYAVAASILDGADPDDALPPLTAYYVMRVGSLPLVPYFPPGDELLAAAVGARAKHSHAVLFANHGQVVAGRTLLDAQYAAEELEETAKLSSCSMAGTRDL